VCHHTAPICKCTHVYVTRLIFMCNLINFAYIYVCIYILKYICIDIKESTSACAPPRSTYLYYMLYVYVCMHMWHGSFSCVQWAILMCALKYSHVWHFIYMWNSFICAIWLIHVPDKNHSRQRHESWTCVMCTSFAYVTWLDSFTHVIMTHSHTSNTTHLHAWHDSQPA